MKQTTKPAPWKKRPELAYLFFILISVAVLLLLTFTLLHTATPTSAATLPMPGRYDTGTPTNLLEIWVDPVQGDDAFHGNTPAAALRTLNAAWEKIPANVPLTQGVLIHLLPGTYTRDMIPVYWSSRHGTFEAPIWIQGSASSRAQVVLQAGLNIYDTDYLYLENLSIVADGDVFHCELCNHTLLRNLVLSGGARQAQEVIKANQSQYFYLEDNDIHGAWSAGVSLVAVQYGHIIGNHVHDAGDWCAVTAGGSAYFRVEANTFYECDNGGFLAGQSTASQYMVSPWIQYEAYDIKVINNFIHDTDGAGLGVNGGYNILLAHNTLYRVGSRSHILEISYGSRFCAGEPGEPGRELCQQHLDQGGWGTTEVDNGSNAVHIPNRNVYIYNNIIYNPSGYRSQWTHFAIHDARSNPASSNIPTAAADTELHIRGNIIWNGDASMPLGIEDNLATCANSNATCNEAQLRAENAINTVRPAFANMDKGDFHPSGNWIGSVTVYDIPDFAWEFGEVPNGDISNNIPTDYEGVPRSSGRSPGAYGSQY